MRLTALLLAATCVLAACSTDQPEPSADPTDGSFTLPEPRDDALARSEVGRSPETYTEAVEGTAYLVHAVCEGAESMSYVLYVNDEERSSRTFQCGKEVRHTGFIAEGGETSRVELHSDDDAGRGFAEVVPHR